MQSQYFLRANIETGRQYISALVRMKTLIKHICIQLQWKHLKTDFVLTLSYVIMCSNYLLTNDLHTVLSL